MKRKKLQYSSHLRATVYLVLFAFLFAQFAPYLTFKAKQYWVKKEIKSRIKRGIPESELISFTEGQLLDSKDFSWLKTGKEFFYKGNLYDIVNASIINSELNFNCINDKQEKQLFADLDKMIQQTSGKDSQKQNQYKSVSLSLYDLNPIADFSVDFPIEMQKTIFQKQNTLESFKSIFIPPPNCFN